MHIALPLGVLILGIFGLACFFALSSLFRRSGSGQGRASWAAGAGSAVLLATLIGHGIMEQHIPIIGPFEVLSVYALSMTILYLILSRWYPMRSTSALLLPYVTVMVAAGIFNPGAGKEIGENLRSVWLNLHILTALVGYAMFTLACVFAVTYLVQDRNLKHKRLGVVFQRLPGLEVLDRLMSGQIAWAFGVFTVAILLGGVLAHQNHWQAKLLRDPKAIAAVLTWAVYAVLFYLRTGADHHGRKLAIFTVVGFACLLATFFGVNLLGHGLHNLSSLGDGSGGGP